MFFNVAICHSATSVTKDAITWTFDADYTVGTYVNGDYWVIPDGDGDVDITAITPAPTTISGFDANGSMVNPVPANAQGYTGLAVSYNSALNEALNLPLALVAGDNIVSTTSQDVTSIKTVDASVLNVVSEAPPSGSFRPGYCDTARTLYNESNLDYSKLATLTPTVSSPTPAAIEDGFIRVWLDHSETTVGRHMHPANNMENYGNDVARQIGRAALVLNMNYSNAAKENLLIGFIQIGIDLHSIYKSGGYALTVWHNDGGHSHGRKLPILFAGMVLNDAAMKAIGAKTGDYKYQGVFNADATFTPPADYFHFGEDDTTFYVTQDTIDIANGIYWEPDCTNPSNYDGLLDMPEWSIKYSSKPFNACSSWTASYRGNTFGNSLEGLVLTAHIMGLKTLWNHAALFDYTDRYVAIASGDADPFGYIVNDEISGNRSNDFVTEMWDTYRLDYSDAPTGFTGVGTGSFGSGTGSMSAQ